MPGDDLDDLGLKPCPRCLEPMEPEGDVIEQEGPGGGLVAVGSAYWACPRCEMTAVD